MSKRKTNCESCINCIFEHGYCVECCEPDMTEEEVEKFWGNNEDGCPYFQDEEEIVVVTAFYKGTGYIATVTSCSRKDANRYARYYRSIGYNAKVLTYEQLEKIQNKESKERMCCNGI